MPDTIAIYVHVLAKFLKSSITLEQTNKIQNQNRPSSSHSEQCMKTQHKTQATIIVNLCPITLQLLNEISENKKMGPQVIHTNVRKFQKLQ